MASRMLILMILEQQVFIPISERFFFFFNSQPLLDPTELNKTSLMLLLSC